MQGLDSKDIMNVLTGQDTSDQMYDASMFGGPNGGLGVGPGNQLSTFDEVMAATGDTEVAKEMAKLKAAEDKEQAVLNQIVKEGRLEDSAIKNVLDVDPGLIRMEQEARESGNVNLAAATQAVMDESDYMDLEELTDSYAAAFGVNKEDIVSKIKEITKGQPDPASDAAVIKTISSQVLEAPFIPPPPQLLPTPSPGFGQAPMPMSVEEMYPDVPSFMPDRPNFPFIEDYPSIPPPPPPGALAQPQPVPWTGVYAQGKGEKTWPSLSGLGAAGAAGRVVSGLGFEGILPFMSSPNIVGQEGMLDPETGLPKGVPYNPTGEYLRPKYQITDAVAKVDAAAKAATKAATAATTGLTDEALFFHMTMYGNYEGGNDVDNPDSDSFKNISGTFIPLFSIAPDPSGGSYPINFYYAPSSEQIFGYRPDTNAWKSLGSFALDDNNLNISGWTFTLDPDERVFTWSEDLGLGRDVTAVSDLGIAKEVTPVTAGIVDDTTSMTAATAGMVDPTPFMLNPSGLWEALRVAQLGPKAEMPQWYSTRMQGFIPRFGDYLLSRTSRGDIFEDYLKRTAKEKTSPTDAAANWDMAVEASRTIGSLQPESSDFARIIDLQDKLVGNNAKHDTLAMLSSHLNINPYGYAGAGAYKRLGDMYDRYETRQAFKTGGGDPSGTFLSWISTQMAPSQPIGSTENSIIKTLVEGVDESEFVPDRPGFPYITD